MAQTSWQKLKYTYESFVQHNLNPWSSRNYVRADFGLLFDRNGRPRSQREYNRVAVERGESKINKSEYDSLVQEYFESSPRSTLSGEINFQRSHLEQIFKNNKGISKWLKNSSNRDVLNFYNETFFGDDADFNYDDLGKISDILSQKFNITQPQPVGRPRKV